MIGTAPDGVAPDLVPRRRLPTGAQMPAVGLGTFGSDHDSAATVAEAVRGEALRVHDVAVGEGPTRHQRVRVLSPRPRRRFSRQRYRPQITQ